jgi:hypothetical protein
MATTFYSQGDKYDRTTGKPKLATDEMKDVVGYVAMLWNGDDGRPRASDVVTGFASFGVIHGCTGARLCVA